MRFKTPWANSGLMCTGAGGAADFGCNTLISSSPQAKHPEGSNRFDETRTRPEVQTMLALVITTLLEEGAHLVASLR